MYQISVPQKFIVSILFILQYIYVSVWNYSLFFSLSFHCFIQSIHTSDCLCSSAFPAESLKTRNKNKVFSKLPLNRWQNVAGKMVTSSWIYDSLLLNRWLPTAEQMTTYCWTDDGLLRNGYESTAELFVNCSASMNFFGINFNKSHILKNIYSLKAIIKSWTWKKSTNILKKIYPAH